ARREVGARGGRDVEPLDVLHTGVARGERHVDGAESALGVDRPGLAAHVGAGGQLDGDVGGAGREREDVLLPRAGEGDRDRGAVAVDAHGLGGADAARPRGVRRQDRDDDVVTLAGDHVQVGEGHVDGDGDGVRGGESGHDEAPGVVSWWCQVGSGGGCGDRGQRTQPVTRAEPRGCGRAACAAGRPVVCSSAAATARTSHVFTETPSRAAAVSTCVLRWSGRRRVVRVVAPVSTSAATAGRTPAAEEAPGAGCAGTAGSGDAGAATTNSGEPPRRRTSTDPGASSAEISPAAADSASSSTSRTAASSGAVSRSATLRPSSPAESAAAASRFCRSSTYGVRSMTPL